MTDTRYAKARAIYNEVKRPGKRVLTLPEIQRVIEAHEAQATQLADAQQMLRNVLVNISDALGLPLTEAGRPRANSFLYRELGRAIECHDWEWPPEHPGEIAAIAAARATEGDTPNG